MKSEGRDDIIRLPDDALPKIEELTGDLRLLAEITGVPLALAVAQVLGGTMLRIPKGDKWIRRWRDRCIRREYDQGVPVAALARKYRLTDRQIWNILGTAEPDGRQMRMW